MFFFFCGNVWKKRQEATKIFEEMHDAGVVPSLMTYNTLMAGCVRAEAPNEAMAVFNLMKEKCIKRDQVGDVMVTSFVRFVVEVPLDTMRP